MKTLMLILIVIGLSFAQPKPFGLELGVSTKEQVLSVIRKEGGRDIELSYGVIEGDIVNPNVEEVKVYDLPIRNLTGATFWFYKGKLFKIEYTFYYIEYSSYSTDEFQILYEQLSQKYGKPNKHTENSSEDSMVEWNFGSVRMSLTLDRFDEEIYLTYEHLPTLSEVEKNNEEIFKKEIAKPRKGI